MMFDKDVVCRAALYPKFVTPEGVFDDQALLLLSKLPDDKTYALSVASKFLAPGVDGVHQYGCTAAELANARFIARHNREPEPLHEQVHYVGHYDLEYGKVVGIDMSYYKVSCKWAPEHNLQSHFQVEFHEKPGLAGSKKDRRNDRIAAIGVLAGHLLGPQRFIAPRDEPSRVQLEAIDLPELPRSVKITN